MRQAAHVRLFVFPRSALVLHGIVSDADADADADGESKRGFRLYPPWSITDNEQARRTQRRQTDYFLSLEDGRVDLALALAWFGVSP